MGKGLILAIGFTVLHVVVVTVLFRCARPTARAATMLVVFVATLPIFVSLHHATPPSVWLLPAGLAEPCSVVALGFSLLLYAAFVFGGTLQVYAQADRGLSLRILLDTAAAPTGLTVDDVLSRYSGGRGITWMCRRRIEGMVNHGLIAIVGDQVVNLPKGQRVAAVFGWMRRFLRLD